jgi:hypothetical protein
MHPNLLLQEAEQLHHVSDRLDSLAEQHPVFSHLILPISGSVRSTATLLEVLVATKLEPIPGSDLIN